jgi:hypothetical protein
MFFVRLLTATLLVLSTIVVGGTAIFVALGYLTTEWLFVLVPYVGACCLSIWAVD